MDHHPNILKPDGSNYSSWSYWMYNSILGIELWEIISGSMTKPGPKNQNYTNLLDNWEALNARSLTLIKDNVDPSIKKRLAIFKSAKEAWDYLARLYAQPSLAEKFRIEKEIRVIMQDERSMQEFYCVMTDYWNKLAMMEPSDLSNLDSFKKYREEYCLVQFLLPLKDEFDKLRWSMLGRSPLPSVTEALIELIAGEKRLKAGLDPCCDDKMQFGPINWFELDIRDIEQDYRSIQELFNEMSGIWVSLAKLEPYGLSNLDSFKKYREEHRLMQFLLALRDEFDPLRRSILHRSTTPGVAEAVIELIAEERRLKSSKHIKSVPVLETQFSSLSLEAKSECLHCDQAEHLTANCPVILKNDRSKPSGGNHGVSHQYGKYHPTSLKHLQQSRNDHQPSSSKARPASFFKVDTDQPALSHDMYRYMVNLCAQVNSDYFGESPLESGCYLPPTSPKHLQQSHNNHQPSSSKTRPASSFKVNTDQPALSRDMYRYMVNLCAQVNSDYFGESPLESGCYLPPTSPKHLQQSHNDRQPSSSKTRPASSFKVDTDQPALSRDMYRYMVNLCAQVDSDYFGESPLESGCYLPPHDKEDTGFGTALNTLKILSYNVWFREDLELDERMKAIGDLIQKHSPDVICFQEVTKNIYDIFKQSNWWKVYDCSISDEMAGRQRYFCMQLSKLPVKSFSLKPFSNSRMGRELCMAEIEVRTGKPLIIATSHLESRSPAPPTWDQMYSTERVAQAKEALNHLKKFPNVIFCGDMNWDEDLDGHFPLFDGWIDAWTDLRPRDNGWTYDTKSNPMLSANKPLQRRLDRFICHLHDFKSSSIDMIGMEAIPGLSYCKEKVVRKWIRELMLPVLPSDHYGLLLEIYSQ